MNVHRPSRSAANLFLSAFASSIAFVVLLGLAAPASAEDIAEPATGHRFATSLTYHGKPYTLVGVALRKKFIIKVYAMGLYVEQAAGHQAFPSLVEKAGGRDRAKLLSGDRAQTFVSWGHFGKLGVLHFVRDVDKDKIQEAYREGLKGALSDKAPADLSRDAQAFVALFDKDMKDGQEIRIHTEESGKITLEIAEKSKEGPQNPLLCRALWDIWLGQKTLSKDMQRGLVDRIDELAK